ncbi:uncharacterized protein LOC107265694 isoform X2 [Cephus cinctus]|uniref:Uncharacterized protein LOC107265694 isoform X2 n=1 Tax=Cephus cinctus TaxID=211228 RepID=A0AAJ7BP21_CEPCN|nr:uncharacterized protein LOC107265694 isoform X2 [Cephus cinctus]
MYGGLRLSSLGHVLIATTAIFFVIVTSTDESSAYETVHTSNAAILNRLGLTPLRFSDGHHKKRLAGPEPPLNDQQARIHQQYSRRHGHRDSHVYIVKLPPSQPYYALTKPHKSTKDDKVHAGTMVQVTKSVSGPSVGFHGNGKPARIYHWNLPLVKKIADKKRLLSQERLNQLKKRIQLENESRNSINDKGQDAGWKTTGKTELPVRPKYHENDLSYLDAVNPAEKHGRNNDKRLSYLSDDNARKRDDAILRNSTKMFRVEDSMVYRLGSHENERLGWNLSNELHGSRNTAGLNVPQKVKKHRKKAATSYYAPITSKSGATGIRKNFSGNGKPKAFYVMEKSRKPVYYHPLLP